MEGGNDLTLLNCRLSTPRAGRLTSLARVSRQLWEALRTTNPGCLVMLGGRCAMWLYLLWRWGGKNSGDFHTGGKEWWRSHVKRNNAVEAMWESTDWEEEIRRDEGVEPQVST